MRVSYYSGSIKQNAINYASEDSTGSRREKVTLSPAGCTAAPSSGRSLYGHFPLNGCSISEQSNHHSAPIKHRRLFGLPIIMRPIEGPPVNLPPSCILAVVTFTNGPPGRVRNRVLTIHGSIGYLYSMDMSFALHSAIKNHYLWLS